MNAVRPFGEAAFLVDTADAPAAQALAATLRRVTLPGLTAVVPGRRSVLVEVDPLAADVDVVADALARLEASPIPEAGRLRTIPVAYGGEYGPDLEGVAEAAGLTAGEVIELHVTTELHVLFGGFAPGFAYLGEVAPALHVGRLPTPRTVTPAGSVALADGMSGIYPAALPGGWRVIGRTPLAMFDPRREPPAYLVPGDRVRFVAIDAGEWDEHAGPAADW